jgi:hypothetical protein
MGILWLPSPSAMKELRNGCGNRCEPKFGRMKAIEAEALAQLAVESNRLNELLARPNLTGVPHVQRTLTTLFGGFRGGAAVLRMESTGNAGPSA